MRSVFHIEASTAEEFRAELDRWFGEEIQKSTLALACARKVSDQKNIQSQILALWRCRHFWQDVAIDPAKSG